MPDPQLVLPSSKEEERPKVIVTQYRGWKGLFVVSGHIAVKRS